MWTTIGILLLVLLSFVFGLLLGKGYGPAMVQIGYATLETLKHSAVRARQYARARWRKEPKA